MFAALDDGTILASTSVLSHLKDFFALHFARSQTMIEVYLRSTGGVAERILSDPESVTQSPEMLAQHFRDLTGLEPAGQGALLHARDKRRGVGRRPVRSRRGVLR